MKVKIRKLSSSTPNMDEGNHKSLVKKSSEPSANVLARLARRTTFFNVHSLSGMFLERHDAYVIFYLLIGIR